MGTFGVVLHILMKLRDMAWAHMEHRLMVQFTKFHLQSKNWLRKSWLGKQASYFNQKVFFQLKKKPISHPLYLYSGQNVNSSWDASIEKFCQKWRHSFQFCTKNREKDAIDEMRVERALYIIAAFGVKWQILPYINQKWWIEHHFNEHQVNSNILFEYCMDSNMFICL